jgi:hypothetical protein
LTFTKSKYQQGPVREGWGGGDSTHTVDKTTD